MTAAAPTNVCIIIAAKNAADTIAKAIASALAEPEAAEVIVIDDGSTDDTPRTARAADDGTGRLNVVRFEENRGPAAARNHAIAISRSPSLASWMRTTSFSGSASPASFRRWLGLHRGQYRVHRRQRGRDRPPQGRPLHA